MVFPSALLSGLSIDRDFDEVVIEDGAQLWELPLTDEIAAACAAGGNSRDLDLLFRRGKVTINSIYYEE